MMRDIIYEKLIKIPEIDPDNIFTYRVPEDAQKKSNVIVYFSFLDIPTPHTFYDGDYHNEEYLIQIDVFAPASMLQERRVVSQKIKDLFENDFKWKARGGNDDYDNDLKVYMHSQRFQGLYKILRSV